MALIRWQPFSEIETLRRQMDQIFDIAALREVPSRIQADEMAGVNNPAQITWKPAIELQNTEDNIILRAEIPGVEGKDLDIRVTREAVAISGEHRYENKTERGFRSEFRYGKFQRVIALPVAVQNDQVQAQFNNGILTLTLPKVTEARHQVVKVNLAAQTAPATDANQNEGTPAAETATV